MICKANEHSLIHHHTLIQESRYEYGSSSLPSAELLLRVDQLADQTLPSSIKLFQSPNQDMSPPLSPDFVAGLADTNMESKPIQESQDEVGGDCSRGRHEIVLGGNATVYVSFFSEASSRNR